MEYTKVSMAWGGLQKVGGMPPPKQALSRGQIPVAHTFLCFTQWLHTQRVTEDLRFPWADSNFLRGQLWGFQGGRYPEIKGRAPLQKANEGSYKVVGEGSPPLHAPFPTSQTQQVHFSHCKFLWLPTSLGKTSLRAGARQEKVHLADDPENTWMGTCLLKAGKDQKASSETLNSRRVLWKGQPDSWAQTQQFRFHKG